MKKSFVLFWVLGITSVFFIVGNTPVFAGNDRDGRNDRGGKVMGVFDRFFPKNDDRKIATPPALGKILKKTRMAIASGEITGIDGTTLTIKKNDASYTVLTGEFEKCTTKFRRRFWGEGSLSEYSVGDKVNVYGLWQNEEKTTIEACVIRDLTIQKRFAVFVGDVVSLTSGGWVMTTLSDKRSNQTITVTSTTKFTNRKMETITQADIQVGHRVRIKGLWNRTANTVTDVTSVKDFSLPMRVTGTPTPTPTVTPTVTPSPMPET